MRSTQSIGSCRCRCTSSTRTGREGSRAANVLVDSLVYTRLRVRSRVDAVLGSNMVGLLTDSVLFVPPAFGSFTLVPGQIVGKTVATGLAVAVLLLARSARPQVVRR